MSKTEKYAEENEERVKKGLPTLPYEAWLKEQGQSDLVAKCIVYLDLDRISPNRGTNNKLELTKNTLYYISVWETGTYKSWICKLSLRLGLVPRTVKDNYLRPLIEEGIISKVGSQLRFIGPPENDTGG